VHVLAEGKTQGLARRVHQQSLTIGPFGNTCEVDVVSLEVAIGGCRTHVSTTRRNAMWIQSNNTQQLGILYLPITYYASYISYLAHYHNKNISNEKEDNINHT
jgi:hypothetical protein